VVYPWVRDFISSTITLRCLHSPLQTCSEHIGGAATRAGWWRLLRIPFGSKFAIMWIDNNSNLVTSQSPIQIGGNELIGVGSISSLPDTKFIIQFIPKSRASLDLRSTISVIGVTYPIDLSDAANIQFCCWKTCSIFARYLNVNNNRIIGVANPIDNHDTAINLYICSFPTNIWCL